MIKFNDLKQAVITAKKEEFEFEAVSCSKRHFPGVKGYSIRDFLDEYNRDWEDVLQLSMKLCSDYELPVPHFLYKEEESKDRSTKLLVWMMETHNELLAKTKK